MPKPVGLDPDAPLSLAYLTYRGKPHVGGQGVYTRHLTKALTDLGHTVEVFGGQPYPELDERVKLTKLPSLDLFNDHYPGRFPAPWEFKTRFDLLEGAQFSTGVFPEPLAPNTAQCSPGRSAQLNGSSTRRPASLTSTSRKTTSAGSERPQLSETSGRSVTKFPTQDFADVGLGQ